jgi:diguanylate cyclase (GGDEF)-like protein
MHQSEKIRILQGLNEKPNGHHEINKYDFLRKEYREYFHNTLIHYIRITFLLCILLNAIFWAWDFYRFRMQEVFYLTSVIRGGVIMPTLIFLFFYTKKIKEKAQFQNSITLFGSFIILALGVLIFINFYYGYTYAQERIIIALVAIYTLSGIEHKRCLFLSLLLTHVFIVQSYFTQIKPELFAEQLIILVLINIMGYLYTKKRDHLAQNVFLKNRLLEIYATHDPLTGLNNRNILNDLHFTEQEPLALALIDIDYFKQYNDHYGHTQGDNCLVSISQILTHHTCDNEAIKVVRYGGEELLLIFDNQSVDTINQTINAIVQDLANAKINHAKSPLDYVTISCGVIESLYQGETLKHHIDLADKLLYKAKNSGRNKTVYDFTKEQGNGAL